MSLVAEFTIPAEALPGGETLVEIPDMRVEVERVVPTQELALPFFWVWGPNPEKFMERAVQEPNITDIHLLDRVEEGALFRAEWSPEAEIIQRIKRLNVTIIETIGTSEHWRFEVRTQEQEALSEFQELFQQMGISIHVNQLYDYAEFVEGNNPQLTPEQRETMIAAYREGYFDSPRRITQAELGERFSITHRAVSERLRRGIRNIISSTLLSSRK